MAYYIVHPGYVTLKNNTTVFVDGATLASYYGLTFPEYDIATTDAINIDKGQHVHLYPRADGKYKNIKTEVGDVPDGTLFYATSAQSMRRRKRRGME